VRSGSRSHGSRRRATGQGARPGPHHHEPTDHTSWCPDKGEADYHSAPAGGERSVNAAWRHRKAFPAVAAITGYIAFYRNRADVTD
jgi:uncharacterized protein (DUF427 family)